VSTVAVKHSTPEADLLGMITFRRPSERWWQKPLAEVNGRPLPAELAVLLAELQAGESGAWLNSGGTRSGAIDLTTAPTGKLATVRAELPAFVSKLLRALHAATGLSRGAPDLVIWSTNAESVRFVEVKCPHWDRPSPEQLKFLAAARERGIEASIAEWEFLPAATDPKANAS